MCSSDNKYNGNKQDMWFCLKLCVALYGDDTFTVLGRDHARVSRTLFTLNYHGRRNLQVHGGWSVSYTHLTLPTIDSV